MTTSNFLCGVSVSFVWFCCCTGGAIADGTARGWDVKCTLRSKGHSVLRKGYMFQGWCSDVHASIFQNKFIRMFDMKGVVKSPLRVITLLLWGLSGFIAVLRPATFTVQVHFHGCHQFPDTAGAPIIPLYITVLGKLLIRTVMYFQQPATLWSALMLLHINIVNTVQTFTSCLCSIKQSGPIYSWSAGWTTPVQYLNFQPGVCGRERWSFISPCPRGPQTSKAGSISEPIDYLIRVCGAEEETKKMKIKVKNNVMSFLCDKNK